MKVQEWQGDVKQQGGAFIFGPGMYAVETGTFAPIMCSNGVCPRTGFRNSCNNNHNRKISHPL